MADTSVHMLLGLITGMLAWFITHMRDTRLETTSLPCPFRLRWHLDSQCPLGQMLTKDAQKQLEVLHSRSSYQGGLMMRYERNDGMYGTQNMAVRITITRIRELTAER